MLIPSDDSCCLWDHSYVKFQATLALSNPQINKNPPPTTNKKYKAETVKPRARQRNRTIRHLSCLYLFISICLCYFQRATTIICTQNFVINCAGFGFCFLSLNLTESASRTSYSYAYICIRRLSLSLTLSCSNFCDKQQPALHDLLMLLLANWLICISIFVRAKNTSRLHHDDVRWRSSVFIIGASFVIDNRFQTPNQQQLAGNINTPFEYMTSSVIDNVISVVNQTQLAVIINTQFTVFKASININTNSHCMFFSFPDYGEFKFSTTSEKHSKRGFNGPHNWRLWW